MKSQHRRFLGAALVALLVSACGGSGDSGGEATTHVTATPTFEIPPPVSDPASPGPGREGNGLAFAVVGDFGTGTTEQRAVGTRMCDWRTEHPFNLVLTTGDNVYQVGDPALFGSAFFDPYQCLLQNGVQFHGVLGNHDVITDGGLPEISQPAFGIPSHNYVFVERGVRFVMFDSNALDLAWLEQALQPEPGERWTVVVFHHPVHSPGTSHGSTPGFAETLGPMFERYGVDLVLNGHDHIFAATREINGIRYIVTGGGGALLGGCNPLEVIEVCIPAFHFLYVTVLEGEITVQAVPIEGEPLYALNTDGLTVEPSPSVGPSATPSQ